MIIKATKLFFILQIIILALLMISKEFYINFNTAFLSAFLVIVASFFAHYRSINKKIASHDINPSAADDLVERIDDPYDLYSPSEEIELEDADFKQIVKDEKAKIKTFNFQSIKQGSGGSFSLFRLGAYATLIIGFMALKNNQILQIMPYLIGLGFGIMSAIFITKAAQSEK